MKPVVAGRFLRTVGIWFFCASSLLAAQSVTLTGVNIPERLPVGHRLLLSGSDSAWFNGQLLARGVDYRFDSRRGVFEFNLPEPSESDTLVVRFTPLPAWLEKSFGTPLPDISEPTSRSVPAPMSVHRQTALAPGNLTISGAKTFRVIASGEGRSEFSQSLDVAIEGNLTPTLKISGAVSDRGYDPAYGSSNARISELDKLNLQLTSPAFTGQVGDIVVQSRGLAVADGRRLSGLALSVRQTHWSLDGTAARPRSRFETVTLIGQDGRQGPYLVISTSAVGPIVPGSETVWLDGRRLERGSGKDYTVDYPAGTITFTARTPIDSRSRIEVDFEPLASDYRKELFAFGGGVALGDSAATIEVGWMREGDDDDNLLAGELSTDDRELLGAIGDDIDSARRSGIVSDTSGAYDLIVDSLPDSLFQFVGAGNGEYQIVFSYVGSGGGSYRYTGDERYEFVGADRGDYDPVRIIPVPERTDFWLWRFRMIDQWHSNIAIEFSQQEHDRNLISPLDDGNNGAVLAQFDGSTGFGKSNGLFEAAASGYTRQAGFRARQRIAGADQVYQFLAPLSLAADDRESYLATSFTMRPIDSLRITPGLALLDLPGQFRSRRPSLAVAFRPTEQKFIAASFSAIRSELDSTSGSGSGEGEITSVSASAPLVAPLVVDGAYTFDRRENEYSATRRGTRFHRAQVGVGTGFDRISLELYREDSLSAYWQRELDRMRLALGTERTIGRVDVLADVAYQVLDRPGSSEDNLLAQLSIGYRAPARQLSLRSGYVISEETRRVRGISYLEVPFGVGDYIRDGDQYIPEPGGNFIRVDEILSDEARVRRGEKTFQATKGWSQARIELRSDIEEELLPDGRRTLVWVLPFYSDHTQPYQYYRARYYGSAQVIPLANGYAIRLELSDEREIRLIGGSPRIRYDRQGSLRLRQAAEPLMIEESLQLFQYDRDVYFSGGGVVEGFESGVGVRITRGRTEWSAGGRYRRADQAPESTVRTYIADLGLAVRVVDRGEVRLTTEFYRQEIDGAGFPVSYLITDARFGSRGVRWTVAARLGLPRGLRINGSITGQHSDERTARIVGRAEFVAGF